MGSKHTEAVGRGPGCTRLTEPSGGEAEWGPEQEGRTSHEMLTRRLVCRSSHMPSVQLCI